MCVICVKPKGVEMPPWKAIENCFDSNPNGAGFAVIRNGMVDVKKGIFVYDDYRKQIQKADIRKDEPALFHMRIATHGGFGHECTHPFPITSAWNDMHKKEYRAKSVLAHNGVFSDMNGTSKKNKVSDTMVFAKMLAETGLHTKAKNNDYWRDILYRTVGTSNKIAIMYKTGEILINKGSWEKEHGCYFSNNSYKDSLFFNNYGAFPVDYPWGAESMYDWDYVEDDYNSKVDKYRNRTSYVSVLATTRQVYDIGNGICPDCKADLEQIHVSESGNDKTVFRCDTCLTDWELTDTDYKAIKDVFPDIEDYTSGF